MDWFNRFVERTSKFIDHNRWTMLACILIVIGLAGCSFLEATVDSLSNPGTKVNQVELEEEIDTLTVQFEARAIQLKGEMENFAKKVQSRRDELYRNQTKINEIVGALKTAIGTYVPIQYEGVITALFAVFGAGAYMDNRRKDRVIEGMKEEIPTKVVTAPVTIVPKA